MPVTKEFTVFLEDRAGTLGKICQALADHGVRTDPARLQGWRHALGKLTSILITRTAVWSLERIARWSSLVSLRSGGRLRFWNKLRLRSLRVQKALQYSS